MSYRPTQYIESNALLWVAHFPKIRTLNPPPNLESEYNHQGSTDDITCMRCQRSIRKLERMKPEARRLFIRRLLTRRYGQHV